MGVEKELYEKLGLASDIVVERETRAWKVKMTLFPAAFPLFDPVCQPGPRKYSNPIRNLWRQTVKYRAPDKVQTGEYYTPHKLLTHFPRGDSGSCGLGL